MRKIRKYIFVAIRKHIVKLKIVEILINIMQLKLRYLIASAFFLSWSNVTFEQLLFLGVQTAVVSM